MKTNIGWTTSQTMQNFYFGVCNSYRLISSSVTNTKRKDPEKTIQAKKSDITLSFNKALRTKLPLRGRKCNK